jgi:protein-L-isoaspartate(D-aspartate) O-methyltransferase
MNLERARTQMLEQQVRAWDVLDPRVLDAMAQVPREEFVPPRYRGVAFADTAVPLGHGQVMMTPKVEGRLLQALSPEPADRVLEVGTGSGFLAACLAQLAAEVTTVEIFPDLSEGASRVLGRLAVSNVRVEVGDVFQALPSGSYDAVAVTGSLPIYDPRFEGLLSPGGRLFVIVGQAPVMEALLVTRLGQEGFARESLFETVLPALRHAPAPSAFEW